VPAELVADAVRRHARSTGRARLRERDLLAELPGLLVCSNGGGRVPVGFVSQGGPPGPAAGQYRPLDPKDIPAVLEHYWQQLGLEFDPAHTDEAANTITRITGGNFRLIERFDE
jgi:hypothetical protein